jgi:hypothetical protein
MRQQILWFPLVTKGTRVKNCLCRGHLRQSLTYYSEVAFPVKPFSDILGVEGLFSRRRCHRLSRRLLRQGEVRFPSFKQLNNGECHGEVRFPSFNGECHAAKGKQTCSCFDA